MIHIERTEKGIRAHVAGKVGELAEEYAVGLAHVFKQLGEDDGAKFLAEVVITAMEVATVDSGESVSVDMRSIIRAIRKMEDESGRESL